ncbi:MAG TPA: glucosaminidase domain-containing protein [Chitinophagaceae bacterium]|nr:glucosaminidase domain-containing protein [Chitinophagaceae bacterium]
MNAKYLSRQIQLLILLFLLSVPVYGQRTGDEYVEQHKQTAILLMKQSGIPASIILGVSMVESAMGKSKNCRLLNNYFGIKGKNTLHKGKSGHRSAYKQYPSAAASFKDFVRIVSKKKYYPALRGNMDYKKWLVHMNKHGYAEAKGKWINDVSLMIRKYHLTEQDQEDFIPDDDSFPVWGTDSTMLQLQE